MSPDAFSQALEQGKFAANWEAHGHCYGLPRAIDDDIRAGRTVVVNVSRTVIDQMRYAALHVGAIDAHHGSNIPDFIKSLTRIRDGSAEYLLPSHGPVFRKDRAILQNAIDRLTKYQTMADFGTCAVSWPLLDEWEKDVLEGRMPDFSRS
jgi:hypothetical protein